MPSSTLLRWPADPTLPGGRRLKSAFSYRAYLPDPIAGLELQLSSLVAEQIGNAEQSIRTLNQDPPDLGLLEVLARRLLRSESVASSRIEGLELSQRRLAKAEVGQETRDETARSVLANISAMEKAIELGARGGPVRASDIQGIHRALMAQLGSEPGHFRTQQSWIGGNPYNPHGAEFVPPPEDRVAPLIEDLCTFVNRTDLPTLIQAAVAHAQFETIHPFSDGNGRVGRALIHVVLRRRGLAPRYVPPISLVLAGNSREYIGGLTRYREGDTLEWCRLFSAAARSASEKSLLLATRFRALESRWLKQAEYPRADSSAAALIRMLVAYPIVDVATAQRIVGCSKQSANEAVAKLEAAKVIKRINLGKRNRAWEAQGMFEILNAFERALATPERGAPRASGTPFA